MIRAIGIGDNVCDKYNHLGRMYPGGQALNFAAYCKQEGHFATYMGVLGSDEVAAHIERTLDELRVEQIGDVISVQTPGSGGCGDPFLREPSLVLADVVEHKVSVEKAESLYGVAVRNCGNTWRIDEGKTKLLREKR